MLTLNQVWEIEYFGESEFDGHKYQYKDYMYKSEIWKDGEIYARLNNRKAIDDDTRIEYVKEMRK